jgi:hypothetical protein
MKIKNLLIIGNGFDRALGLKTDYKSFIKNHLIKQMKSTLVLNDNIHLIDSQGYFSINSSDIIDEQHLKTKNYFLSRLLNQFNLTNWVDIEELYFKILTEEKYDVKKLNEEFSLIKKELEIYLTSVSKERTGNHMHQFFTGLSKQKENELMVLNFNYTDVFERIYAHLFNNHKTINIHGQLDTPDNPIIFGYAPTDEDTITLINKGNNEFLKNIKRYYYKRTDSELQLNQFLNDKLKTDIHVHILGHSCGVSDRNILKDIFTNKCVKKINIMYHKNYDNYDNYFDTLVNIDRVIGDNSQYGIINNFDNSIRMPQLNEGENDRKVSNQTITNFFSQKHQSTQGVDIR